MPWYISTLLTFPWNRINECIEGYILKSLYRVHLTITKTQSFFPPRTTFHWNQLKTHLTPHWVHLQSVLHVKSHSVRRIAWPWYEEEHTRATVNYIGITEWRLHYLTSESVNYIGIAEWRGNYTLTLPGRRRSGQINCSQREREVMSSDNWAAAGQECSFTPRNASREWNHCVNIPTSFFSPHQWCPINEQTDQNITHKYHTPGFLSPRMIIF